jgi:hypothetical protein
MIHCTPAVAARLTKKFPFVKFYPAGPVKQSAAMRSNGRQRADEHQDTELHTD